LSLFASGVSGSLKGCRNPAQGNALGRGPTSPLACPFLAAFQAAGSWFGLSLLSQGVALGWILTAFQAVQNRHSGCTESSFRLGESSLGTKNPSDCSAALDKWPVISAPGNSLVSRMCICQPRESRP